MEYRLVSTIGGKGSAPEAFTATLRGLAVDAADRLHAVGDREVKVFDRDGALLRRWSTALAAQCVGVADDGSIFVGEVRQVEIFDPGGALLDTWRDPERLGRVTAVGFLGENVLLADARDRSIRRLTRDGRLVASIGKANRMKGFLIPNGVVDFAVAGGRILAANPGKHRVERYTLEGELLGHFGRFDGRDPEGFAGCCNPTNVAVGPGTNGRIYTSEKAPPRVKVYDAKGRLEAIVATDAFDPGCKNMDLVVDSRGRVHVADTVRLRILVFAPKTPAKAR